ncbi:hypothetical protein C9J03_10135 [Photobacterium gaetbulicola]|uniref:Lipoprotein n=1 Tax=Photobacterium gaetbulicola Gung47 TaxID=658445 RepID=A0A0C5WTZ3_9GAMM|nr:hypothetical protein [Photobacterium gaetbulicola]AJR09862.1 hypothetical protein H744_2c3220 [Photobacterium gaetbulicola Gung47]PSU12383.1 hypothetical protein C9J03_10135 [Photobacterium gaetbulicola]
MKFRIATLVMTGSVLVGCTSLQLVPPESHYQGSLPDVYKQELNQLNTLPSTPFRGGVQTYHFDSDTSLLTIIYRLPNPRWSWNLGQKEFEQEEFPFICQQLGHEIHQGLGVRYWFSGGGGFVSNIVTDETCQSFSS